MPTAPPSSLRCVARLWARAPPARCIPSPRRFLHAPRTSLLTRPAPVAAALRRVPSAVRCESSSASSPASSTAPETRLDRDQVPSYELTFTCKVCSTRSSHRLSKQGYHHGTILISCPGCKNRHLISDHLKIFSDKSVTIEDLMRDNGDLVKRGSLSAEGDVEFWEDGSSTPRSAAFIPDNTKGEGRLSEATPPRDTAEDATNGTDSKT